MVADHQGGGHQGRMKLAGDRATSALGTKRTCRSRPACPLLRVERTWRDKASVSGLLAQMSYLSRQNYLNHRNASFVVRVTAGAEE